MPGTPHQTRSRSTAQPIHDRLSGGDPRTLRNVEEVVEIALAEPERLDELIRCVLESDDEIVRMRAGDALEKVCRRQPPLLQPHVWLLLGAMSRIHQHSVQWHVAQMLGHVRLTPAQRRRAAGLMNNNLDESADWIVLNYSLDTLAVLARQDPAILDDLHRQLRRHGQSDYKSLAHRARELSIEFGLGPAVPTAGTEGEHLEGL